ncbi:MAG: PTS system mannose/fructose/sorbose family transporter subunit IID [[Clostridium] scindens]
MDFRQRISQNLERFYALGFLYSMIPALTKIYENNPEELKASMHNIWRHHILQTLAMVRVSMERLLLWKKNGQRGADILIK